MLFQFTKARVFLERPGLESREIAQPRSDALFLDLERMPVLGIPGASRRDAARMSVLDEPPLLEDEAARELAVEP
jgi:hypothetical protein